MKNIIISFVMSCLAFAVSAQQKLKYDDIFYRLPDYSLSQSYSYLLDYQRQNPYFPNTYIQLGIICEQKMVLSDPLSDFETAQFWAEDAKLFFGNFKVFYKENDARSNSDYYANLKIASANKKLTDAEVMAFVDKHLEKCKDFADTTKLIYSALALSKRHYNNCIKTFKEICNDYESLNDALLRQDEKLSSKLDYLKLEIDSCINEFGTYRSLLSKYHIGNYRQRYELREIETFRLDGLTNSDFYENQFSVWDYSKWVDDYNRVFQVDILPLRNRVEQIQQQFDAGKAEFLKGSSSQIVDNEVYDDLFVFQLSKYDNNSLIRDLFKYLDSRRLLFAAGNDALCAASDSSTSVANAKMRYFYRLSQLHTQALSDLQVVKQSVTKEKVAHFAQFFWKYYRGVNGLSAFYGSENKVLDEAMDRYLSNFATYLSNNKAFVSMPIMSAPSKFGAVPLWMVGEEEKAGLKTQNLTSVIAYDGSGRVAYAGGTKATAKKSPFVARIDENGAVAWISEVKKASEIKSLKAVDDGCIAIVREQEQQYLVRFNSLGRETMRSTLTNSNEPQHLSFNEIDNKYMLAFGDSTGHVNVCMADSAGNFMWETPLTVRGELAGIESESLAFVNCMDGSVCVEKFDGEKILKTSVLTEAGVGMKIVKLFQVSRECIIVFLQNADNELEMMNVSSDCEVLYKTLSDAKAE